MQFYKKRDFGSLISDTFNFFKIYGKNYFKNYLMLNGILIILMVFVFAFGYKEILMQIIGANNNGESHFMEQYFQENGVLLFVVIALIFIIFAILMILVYLYPVFYMKRIAAGQQNVTMDEILSDFKNNIGRIIIYTVCTLFVVYPLMIIGFGFIYALMLIIIGFFLLILVMPALMNAMFFMLFDYFNTSKGFFESLSYAIRSQFSYSNGREKSPFWKYWGSLLATYFIISTITSIFTLIPGAIYFIFLFTSPSSGNLESSSGMPPVVGTGIAIIYGVYLLVSFLMSNLMYVNAGFMYYDSRVDLHKKENLSEIDSIGLHE